MPLKFSLSSLPSLRDGDLIFGPLEQDESGVTFRAWSPAAGGTVALWVDAKRISDDPTRAERLVLQALAASRLRHPNLAEVHRVDVSRDRVTIAECPIAPAGHNESEGGTVEGRPSPSVSVRRAVAIVLHAARGLRLLHEHGIAHGGIRPDRLMVHPDGRVILTGLSRFAPPPDIDESRTPLPCPDPDAIRADIIALGRTLSTLVTGSASTTDPSTGTGEVPSPESVNRRVPASLSDLIRRMTHPEAEGDFTTMGPVVSALEDQAAVPSSGAFLPREERVESYRQCARAYQQAPTARLRRRVLAASYGGTAALASLAGLIGLPRLALGLFGLIALTATASFVIGGLRRDGALFDRVRRFVLGGRPSDLVTAVAAVSLIIAGLVASGTLDEAIALGVVAAILAGVQEYRLERRIEAERAEPLRQAIALLRDLRVHGLSEQTVRAFARDHGGESWSPLYRAVFGYEIARMSRRHRVVPFPESVRNALQDRLIDALDARLRKRSDERMRRFLQPIEERKLEAAGVYLLTARRRSHRIVAALLARLREIGGRITEPTDPPIIEQIRQAVRNPESVLAGVELGPSPTRRRLIAVLDGLIGPRVRFLAGLVLLVGFLAWAHQNRLMTETEVRHLATQASQTEDISEIGEALEAHGRRLHAGAQTADPLHLSGPLHDPAALAFRDANAGAAGFLLLFSALFPSRILGLSAILAAIVALFGSDLGLPALGPLGLRASSLAVGLLLVIVGIGSDRVRRSLPRKWRMTDGG